MPFTFAHPVVVLPFKNKYFNLSGLILGSMAPDIIYFILFSPSSNLGHTLWGSILFNLPMCFLLNYLFYKYIQQLFIFTLPKFISERYMYMIKNKNILLNKTDIIKFIYSCLIGMSTHVLWDSFTHRSGIFVKNIDLLRNNIILFNISIPIYKIMQHGSTIIGIFIICIYIWKNRGRVDKRRYINIDKNKTCLIIICSTLILTALFINIFVKMNGFIGIGRIIITFINSVFLSYLILGFVLYKKNIINE